MYTKESLRALFPEVMNDVPVTIPGSDGSLFTITAYSMFICTDIDDVEWFNIWHPTMHIVGDGTVNTVLDYLNNTEKYLTEDAGDKAKLYKYFLDHQESWQKPYSEWSEEEQETFGFYSDWHKDVWGFRPHGIVYGILVH